MYLERIKIAGFKSFVDPTVLHFVSNLVAVVGPNGCGKSNVIDAVRWVMGESSAKNLRGGTLTDVIFNGSTSRKPIGLASVELLFNNAEGKLGGEYAQYSEIAIKRQVTRDGVSTYYLNGQRCRRKDVTDIFLGTGLGPRSYAIIEQGTISRIIEAKPEDLRVFLEEAAGVSKYKERRKETQRHIEQTQQNLARLGDLQEELDKQLKHLHRQSQQARLYQELSLEAQTLSAQLAALSWKGLAQRIELQTQLLAELNEKLQISQEEFEELKANYEVTRLTQKEKQEEVNILQEKLFNVATQIAKLEQTIQHHKERQAQLKTDQVQAEQTLLACQQQLAIDAKSLSQVQDELIALEPQYNLQNELNDEASFTLQAMEEELEAWHQQNSTIQGKTLNFTRVAESEKSKITQLERQLQQLIDRQARLDQELASQQQTIDPLVVEALNEKINQQEETVEELGQSLTQHQIEFEDARKLSRELITSLKSKQNQYQDLQAEVRLLQGLQAQALGKNHDERRLWLEQQQLNHAPSLLQQLKVKLEYASAIETVLGDYLEALLISPNELSQLLAHLNAPPQGLTLITSGNVNQEVDKGLLQGIENPEILPSHLYALLSRVQYCETLPQALEKLSGLNEGSVITANGYWLSHDWIKVKAHHNHEESILLREQKLAELQQAIIVLKDELNEFEDKVNQQDDKLKELELQKDSLQQTKQQKQQELIALQGEARLKQNQVEQFTFRKNRVQQELADIQKLQQQHQEEVNLSRQLLEQALEEMVSCNEEQTHLNVQREELQQRVTQARFQAKAAKEKLHEVNISLQTLRTREQALQENSHRLQQQIEQAKERVTQLVQLQTTQDSPQLETQDLLEELSHQKSNIDQQLNEARLAYQAVEEQIQAMEQKLSQMSDGINHYRNKLEQAKLHEKELSVHQENNAQRLQATTFTIEELLQNLPPEATIEIWQQQLNTTEHKIQKLGAINLAAIEEFEEAQTRKTYLDTQCGDLNEALRTLDEAIKKIDKETRVKFQETFDKVNAAFIELFPTLFGGGEAYLELLGDDLLETGVSVMARPPGKKNSTIQLLSGGEKALTAVALVFSIFQLNPAPFCMLDEVDAPLDDNNVGRYCNLVKHMSKNVQFIYISHNKLAIEMAEQLQGVTMREPGVSRLVTVDIEEAKSMVEA